MTLLHVFHRSIAAAVQRIDPEILRIIGTVLIPMDILPSIARVSEADYGKFLVLGDPDSSRALCRKCDPEGHGRNRRW